MPAGAPFESHIPPYPQIRVDHFSATTHSPAWINLLSHVHSDHTQGLAASSFCTRVVCSEDSKRMLLLLESTDDRINYDRGLIAHKKRTFAALKSDGKPRRDLLLGLPLNTPTKLDISPSEIVTLTLVDANHCPGAVMFLVEGQRGAVLHTGDIRAEQAMVIDLSNCPRLAPYLQSPEDRGQSKTLDCIYLDTASMLGTQNIPSKAESVNELVELLALYPQDTQFFINTWTWGYEDMLLKIAIHFNTKIHVDRYKYTVLTSLEHYAPSPSLTPELHRAFKDILTCDANITRFHACERFNQCDAVKGGELQLVKRKRHRGNATKEGIVKKVVYINPSAMAEDTWKAYTGDIAGRLQNGEFIDALRVPLGRHSTLVELQAFVARFRPRNVFPNTLIPHLDGLDWACLPGIFAHCLSLDGYETLRKSTLDGLRDRFPGIDLSLKGMELRAKRALGKISRPDSDHDNAVGSSTCNNGEQEQEERLMRIRKDIDTYLPWLFGCQNVTADVTREPTPPVPAKRPPSPTADGTRLFASCASCPTCSSKCPRSPSKRILANQASVGSSSSPATIPLLKSETNTVLSSKLGHRNRSACPVTRPMRYLTSTSNDVHDRPTWGPAAKRPRHSEVATYYDTACTNVPGIPNPPSGMLNYGNLLDPLQQQESVSVRSPLCFQPSSCYPFSDTGSRPQNIRISSANMTPVISPPIQEPTLIALHESDLRDRRRFSKIKERQIKDQLAKLPLEFSQTLAATKLTSRTRFVGPNVEDRSVRPTLVQRMQSGEFGPLDLDLGCVQSQSQGKATKGM